MSDNIVIGTNVQEVTQKLVNDLSSVHPNKVEKLESSLCVSLHPFLSPSLREIDSLFGLRLNLKTKPSMAHSGWLFSRYYNACHKLKLDYKTIVTSYSNGFFRELGQFEIMDSGVLFLGFGQSGAKMLEVILQAELQFNPRDFDSDGYQI